MEYDEKRDYVRSNVNCNITYKLADSINEKTGLCTSLSGSGVSFIADCVYGAGLAMEIKIFPKNSVASSMTAYIEVIRSIPQNDGSFEIAGSIKILK